MLALARRRRPSAAGPQPPALSRRPSAAGPQPPARRLPPRPLLAAGCFGLLLALTAMPARAGSWSLTYSASGTETTTPVDTGGPFSDSATGTNGVSSTKSWTTGFGFPGSVSTKQTITVKVTGTWVSTGGDNASDPPPPSVIVVESVRLDQDGKNGDGSLAAGTFDDGFGDQPSAGGSDQTCGTSNAIPIPPQYLTVQSGTISLQHTFTVGSSASTDSNHDAASAAAHFDSYSATVHAQPYNFQLGPYFADNGPLPGQLVADGVGVDDTNGQLHFHYVWSSTDGKVADLGSCTVYENVSYKGNSSGSVSGGNYYPPNPPFNYSVPIDYNQPDPNGSQPASGADGYIDDFQLRGPLTPAANAVAAQYNSVQNWEYNDAAIGQIGTIMPGPVTSPITITRTVIMDDRTLLNPWTYYVIKSGYSAYYAMP